MELCLENGNCQTKYNWDKFGTEWRPTCWKCPYIVNLGQGIHFWTHQVLNRIAKDKLRSLFERSPRLTLMAYYFQDLEARNVELSRRMSPDRRALFSNTMQESCSYWRKMTWHPGVSGAKIVRSSLAHAAGSDHGVAGPLLPARWSWYRNSKHQLKLVVKNCC